MGGALATAGSAVLATAPSAAVALAGLVLAALGTATLFPALLSRSLRDTDPAQHGRATSAVAATDPTISAITDGPRDQSRGRTCRAAGPVTGAPAPGPCSPDPAPAAPGSGLRPPRTACRTAANVGRDIRRHQPNSSQISHHTPKNTRSKAISSTMGIHSGAVTIASRPRQTQRHGLMTGSART